MNTRYDDKPSAPADPGAAEKLRELISKAGLSQRAAARELDVDERTMRYWCAGNPPPPRIALRALHFGVAHRLYLLRLIEQNKKQIEMLESGAKTIGFGKELGTREAALKEAHRLRLRTEEHEIMLLAEEAFKWYQEAIFLVTQQFLPHGNGQPTEESISESAAAHAEWRAAQQELDRVGDEIRTGKRDASTPKAQMAEYFLLREDCHNESRIVRRSVVSARLLKNVLRGRKLSTSADMLPTISTGSEEGSEVAEFAALHYVVVKIDDPVLAEAINARPRKYHIVFGLKPQDFIAAIGQS